jgi:uncharacterized membrane-anchored protein
VISLVAVAGAAEAKPAKPAAKPAVVKPADAKPAADAADAAPADPLANVKHVTGPKLVDLGHGAQINLPADTVLLEHAEAQAEMRKSGNEAENVIALIVPTAANQDWYLVIEADDVGYVTDDDADDLDAGELLNSYKEGTAELNKKREPMGIPPLLIDDWSEKPRYDKAAHHLVWGIAAHSRDGKVINYFTRILGRNGFLSADLIGSGEKMEASKVQAAPVITAVQFKPGSGYADHVSDDKSSGVGLKGLLLAGVGIAVVKKTGILIAVFLFLKKGVILVVAAVGAFLKRLFGGRKKQEMAVAPPPVDLPPATVVSSGMDAPPPAPPTGQGFDPPGGSGPPPHDPLG